MLWYGPNDTLNNFLQMHDVSILGLLRKKDTSVPVLPKEKIYDMVKSGTLKVNETYKTKNGYDGYLFLRRDIEELASNKL